MSTRPAPNLDERESEASALLLDHPGVDASTPLIEVSERHFGETELDALAVLEERAPIGLITRQRLTSVLSARFGHALFGRDPIATVADRDALILSEHASLELCLRMAFERSARRAYDDVIVVDSAGRYRGMLSVKELVLHQTDRLALERARKAEALARTERLEEVATMKSRFLSAMTHELRAPLNTILGAGELLDAYLASGEAERAAGHVRTLRASAAHLRALVDNVLDQAKLEAGKMSVSRERFDVCALAREIADAVRILALPEVEVGVEMPEGPLELDGDPVKLRQIAMNLGSNAAKFTERGEITIRVTPLSREIELSVIDTGPGIPVEHVPHLFAPFTQLSRVETRRHGGTGLGLSLSKQLAELIGGEILVDTRLGYGTTMSLRVPRHGDGP